MAPISTFYMDNLFAISGEQMGAPLKFQQENVGANFLRNAGFTLLIIAFVGGLYGALYLICSQKIC